MASEATAQRLYEDLLSRRPELRGLISPKAIIPYSADGGPAWVVCMSAGSSVGTGLVAVYSDDLTLMAMREMGPVRQINTYPVKGVGEVLIVRETSAAGTGLRGEAMHILDPRRLNQPLWSGEVESWLEGLAGRNEGHMIRHVVLLADLNHDGIDELIDVSLKQSGYDAMHLLLSRPAGNCTVHSFDKDNRRFRPLEPADQLLIYPLPSPQHGSED